MKLLNSLFLLWLVLYFSFVNAVGWYLYVNLQNANPQSYRAILTLIGALVLVSIKVECTLLQDFRESKKAD